MTWALRVHSQKYRQEDAAVVESASLDHQDRPAQMAKMVLTVNQELQVTQVKTHHSLLHRRLQNLNGASNVNKLSLDPLATQDLKAQPANPERQDPLETMALLVRKGCRDHQDLQDHRDRLARRDQTVQQAKAPKQKGRLVLPGLRDPLDLLDPTDQLGHPVHQEQMGQLDLKENQEPTDHQANQDLTARRVLMERLAWQAAVIIVLRLGRPPDIRR